MLSDSWVSSFQRQLQAEQEMQYFPEFAQDTRLFFLGCYSTS